jgi:O-antigen ligase
MTKHLIFAEKVFTVLALLIFTEGLVQLIYEMRTGQYSGTTLEGNLDVIVAFFIIYAIASVLIVLRWKKVFVALSRRQLLLALIALTLASVFWSMEPAITIRRSVAILGTTMFGVYLGTRYTLEEQFRLLLWTFGLAMGLSILFAVLLPSFGIHQSDWVGRWRGIYTHKNTFGRNMGFSFFCFSLLALFGNRQHRWLGWTASAIAIALIILSGSVTPIFSSLAVIVLLPIYSLCRWRYSLKPLIFLTIGLLNTIVLTLVAANTAPLLAVFGRDPTFTGRTPLWAILAEIIQRRPLLGYGYSAFWLGKGSAAEEVWLRLSWQPDYAHNGYFDLALQLGFIGLSLFLIDFSIYFLQTFRIASVTKTAWGMFPLAFFTYLIPYNITDSVILRQNSIIWVLYVALTTSAVVQPVKLRLWCDRRQLL